MPLTKYLTMLWYLLFIWVRAASMARHSTKELTMTFSNPHDLPIKIMQRLTKAVQFIAVALVVANLINITIKWSLVLWNLHTLKLTPLQSSLRHRSGWEQIHSTAIPWSDDHWKRGARTAPASDQSTFTIYNQKELKPCQHFYVPQNIWPMSPH